LPRYQREARYAAYKYPLGLNWVSEIVDNFSVGVLAN